MKLRTTTWNLFEIDDSLHVRKFKTVMDSGFHAVDSGFEILDVGFLRRWNLDSGFQSLVAKSCILDSKAQNSGFLNSNFSDSGFHRQKFPGFPYVERDDTLLFSNHAMPKSSIYLWQHACSCGWQLTNLLQIYYDNSDSHSHKVARTDRQHKAESYDKHGIL